MSVEQTIQAEATGRRRWSVVAAALTGLGLGVAVALAIVSEARNGFYHDDDVNHYLFAEDAWGDSEAMLHVWARPGYNLPTMLAVKVGGMLGCRLFSAAQTALVAWLAFAIARQLKVPGPFAAFAPLLVWIQPLVLLLSATTLTETPAAVYLALGVWMFLRGWRVGACAVVSLCFVTRYETMALAPLWGVFVLWEAYKAAGRCWLGALKQGWAWACIPALAWAPVAYGLAAWLAEIPMPHSPLNMLTRQYTQEYGSGPLWHFSQIWPMAASLGLLALAAVGAAVFVSRGRGGLVASLTYGLVALHSVLFWKGMFATGGYARFLVPLAGLVAVLGARSLEALWQGRPRWAAPLGLAVGLGWIAGVSAYLPWWVRQYLPVAAILVGFVALVGLVIDAAGARRALGRGVAAVLLGLAVAQTLGQVRPMPLGYDGFHSAVAKAVRDVNRPPYAGREMITQHVIVRYLWGGGEAAFGNEVALDLWNQAEPGTLFFWENKYCYKPHEMASTHELYDAMWARGRRVYRCDVDGAVVEVFERRPADPVSMGRLTTAPAKVPDPVYP